MKIYFKDVGQGDSIILEWEENAKYKIGIIDCNKKSTLNPVLEHLKLHNNYQIEFIVLSHPHKDHFSGMLELLDYLKLNAITIHNFFHTCASKKEYIQASMKSISDKSLLITIFKRLDQMHGSDQIKKYGFINDLSSELVLSADIKMKVMSPTHAEYSQFNKRAFKNNSLLNNNPESNYLSTVFKLYTNDWFVLFTSDAPHDVFWRLNRKGLKTSQNKFLCGQIPHHGSPENYYSTFWRIISHDNNTKAVISVGKNDYGHPSKKVIEDLKSNSYDVKCTDYIDHSGTISTTELSQTLDIISENISQNQTKSISKDIVFKIVNRAIVEV